MNRRPVPSRALVMSTGLDSPLATGVSLIEPEETAGATVPSTSGTGRTTADAAVGMTAARTVPVSIAPASTVRRSRRGAIAVVIKSVFPALRRWCRSRSGGPHPAVNRRGASIRSRILASMTDRLQPYLRRPEHDRAAARGAGQGARSRVRPGLRRPGPRLPAPCRPRPRAAPARRPRVGARRPRRAGPRPRRRDRRPRPRLRVRPAPRRRRRRDPAAARQAEPGRRAGGPRTLDAGGRHPDARPDRGARARSRAATRSGSAPTSCASGGRCGPTTPARASSPRSWAATPASSTSRTGRARRSSSTCCR